MNLKIFFGVLNLERIIQNEPSNHKMGRPKSSIVGIGSVGLDLYSANKLRKLGGGNSIL